MECKPRSKLVTCPCPRETKLANLFLPLPSPTLITLLYGIANEAVLLQGRLSIRRATFGGTAFEGGVGGDAVASVSGGAGSFLELLEFGGVAQFHFFVEIVVLLQKLFEFERTFFLPFFDLRLHFLLKRASFHRMFLQQLGLLRGDLLRLFVLPATLVCLLELLHFQLDLMSLRIATIGYQAYFFCLARLSCIFFRFRISGLSFGCSGNLVIIVCVICSNSCCCFAIIAVSSSRVFAS
jgi:hypothetical protein